MQETVIGNAGNTKEMMDMVPVFQYIVTSFRKTCPHNHTMLVILLFISNKGKGVLRYPNSQTLDFREGTEI